MSMSVGDAARQLGVSDRRVRERIAAGSLSANRLGSQWVIDAASLPAAAESSSGGRPMSARSVWALISASDEETPSLQEHLQSLSAVQRHVARRRFRKLLGVALAGQSVEDVAILLRSHFRNSAERISLRAAERDLADLRGDDRIMVAGLSHPLSEISSGDVVEGYLAPAHKNGIVSEYLLDEVADGNVVLHVLPVEAPILSVMPTLLIAADLAAHRRAREEERAVQLLLAMAIAAGAPDG